MKKYIIILMTILIGCNGNSTTNPGNPDNPDNPVVTSYNCSYDWGADGWGNGTPAWCEGNTLTWNTDDDVVVYNNSGKSTKVLRLINEVRVLTSSSLHGWLDTYKTDGNVDNSYNDGRGAKISQSVLPSGLLSEYRWYFTGIPEVRINITNK